MEKVCSSIAQALAYKASHEDHFGFAPAAIKGDRSLFHEISERMERLGRYGNTSIPRDPLLVGMVIVWQEETT